MTIEHSDLAIIEEIAIAEREHVAEMRRLYGKLAAPIDSLKLGASKPSLRPYILRTVMSLSVNDREQLFEFLIELSTITHSDLDLCKNIIKTLPRGWVDNNIIRALGLVPLNEETARRGAELLYDLRSSKLQIFLEKLSEQDDPEILEVRDDFQNRLDGLN